MRYRKTRRFRHRPNGRNHQNRINGGDQMRHRPSSFSTERTRVAQGVGLTSRGNFHHDRC